MGDLVDRLRKLDTSAVSDALDQLGLPGVVIGLSSFTVKDRIAGHAVTVKLGPPRNDLPKVHLGVRAIIEAETGDVIVVEHPRTDVSGWGGLLSRGAIAKKVSGVVIDGGFRDIDEARELGLPIYARAAVPITARGRISEHAVNQPIKVGGTAVNPRDLVLADGSGVVFIAANRAEEVVSAAEVISAKEALMARAIDAGEALTDVLGTNYEDMLKGEAAS